MIQNIQIEFRKRVYEESFFRIQKCVGLLSDEELWNRPNEHLVSVANLILHLNGNIKQWILSGIANKVDTRQRDLEFSTEGGVSREELLSQLEDTIKHAVAEVNNLAAEDLNVMKSVQCFEESVLSIIIHVIEHTSYHSGQITYYTKLIKNMDTGYYANLDLMQTKSTDG